MTSHDSLPRRDYGFLTGLSLNDLEYLLRLSSSASEIEALSDAVANEIIKRETEHPTGRVPDVDEAWNEFQVCYNISGRLNKVSFQDENIRSEQNEVGPSKQRKQINLGFNIYRFVATIAISISILFSVMISAQAFGLDIFGALARWTEDTFHFVTSVPKEDSVSHDTYDRVQISLNTAAIPGEFVPTWCPEGFEITEINTTQDEEKISVRVTYSSPSTDPYFMSIEQYEEATDIDLQIFEMNADSVEEYLSKGKHFYIFSNADKYTATYVDQSKLQVIWGNLTAENLKTIIDSIGGRK